MLRRREGGSVVGLKRRIVFVGVVGDWREEEKS